MRLFILTILISLNLHASSDCEQHLDDCEYYSCIEEEKHCDKRGYLLGFGLKYCRKFEVRSGLLSKEGQEWMESVRSCLIERLEEAPDDLTCRKFKKHAIRSHVPCYTETGYCELSKKDRKTIIKTIRKSLWRPSMIRAGIKILKYCKLE